MEFNGKHLSLEDRKTIDKIYPKAYTSKVFIKGSLAQLVEQQTLNLAVLGSIPRWVTKKTKYCKIS